MKGDCVKPDISILICSKNRRNSLETLVGRLKSLVPSERTEIVVVEETERPEPIPGVRYTAHPVRNMGFAYARNLALKHARGELLIFLDDDVTVPDGWFDEIIKSFEDPEVGAVGGAILPQIDGLNRIGRCISLLGFPAGGLTRYLRAAGKPNESALLSTGNCAVRAQLARDVGCFDLFLRWGGEDQDFFQRVRLRSKTLFVPQAYVFHRQRDSLRSVFSWFVRRGKAEFFRTCKSRGALQALILPLRSNFLLKVFLLACAMMTAGVYLPSVTVLAVPLLAVAWFLVLWRRNRPDPSNGGPPLPSDIRKIRDALLEGSSRWLLPVTRCVMDLGSEAGRMKAFCIYLRNRFLTKPIILTFHDVRDAAAAGPGEPGDYTCSGQQVLRMIEDARLEGRWIVPLSELTRRLQAFPASLFFEQVVSVTFDDGYVSVHDFLKENLSSGDAAVTVFIPTGMLGNGNAWDSREGASPRAIMTREAAQELASMGVAIGSHTRTHADLLAVREAQARSEIKGSLDDLRETILQNRCEPPLFSYPYGRHDQRIIRMVAEAGYAAAFTNLPGHLSPGLSRWQIPRFTVRDGMEWSDIRDASRRLRLRELAKDLRRLVA